MLNQCCSDFYVGLTDAFVGQFDIGSLDGVDEMSQNDEFLDLYPNPASEYVTLILDAKSCGEFEICLIDILGKLVEKKNIKLLSGKNIIKFDTSYISNGLYAFTVKSNNLISTIKFVKNE